MDGYMTLKQFGEMVCLSAATLRDRIHEGRLKAIRVYRGGDKTDPRSWRWLVSERSREDFIAKEIESWWTAVQRGAIRFPGFVRRARDWKGRFAR